MDCHSTKAVFSFINQKKKKTTTKKQPAPTVLSLPPPQHIKAFLFNAKTDCGSFILSWADK